MVIQEIRKFGADQRGSHAAGKDYLTFRDIWSFLRRHILALVALTVAGTGLGGLYLANTEPTYSAIARIVIDHEQARIASQDPSTGTIIIEAAEIASEVEIVKSEAIARAVIRRLNLLEDPEILDSLSWRSRFRSSLMPFLSLLMGDEHETDGAGIAQDEEHLMRRTMAGFLSRVTVNRVGQSYVLEIGYTSTDPAKAARTANAIADAYMQISLEAKSTALTQGAAWLENRLIELGQKAQAAALGVEEFRNAHDITQIGQTDSLDHRQLAEISSQLLAAQVNTATESARLATVNSFLAGETTDGYVGEALNSTQIFRLREDLRLATARLDMLESRYGAGSVPARAAAEEMARLDAEIHRELVRIQGVYKSNLETAVKRERLLREQLEELKRTAGGANLARVELAQLESHAATYRRMYESVLEQLVAAMQKQSFPVGNARMVTAATPPLAKSWPKTTLVLPFSMLLGFAAGISLAGMREFLDRRIGSGERLGLELGLPSLGHVPKTRFHSMWSASADRELKGLRHVLDAPYSGFAEALRSVKTSIDAIVPADGSIVIGVTSVGSGEGKTTIATNLAHLYLNEGVSVVLVDADFADRRPDGRRHRYGTTRPGISARRGRGSTRGRQAKRGNRRAWRRPRCLRARLFPHSRRGHRCRRVDGRDAQRDLRPGRAHRPSRIARGGYRPHERERVWARCQCVHAPARLHAYGDGGHRGRDHLVQRSPDGQRSGAVRGLQGIGHR
jgi:polysaccharide biosynthesis transport protein